MSKTNNPIIKKYLKFAYSQTVQGAPHSDERQNYVGKSGLFESIVSQTKPGKIKAKFYVLDEDNNIAIISTSSGDLKENEEFIIVKTGHSLYGFSKIYQLTEEEEELLYQFADKSSTKISKSENSYKSSKEKEELNDDENKKENQAVKSDAERQMEAKAAKKHFENQKRDREIQRAEEKKEIDFDILNETEEPKDSDKKPNYKENQEKKKDTSTKSSKPQSKKTDDNEKNPASSRSSSKSKPDKKDNQQKKPSASKASIEDNDEDEAGDFDDLFTEFLDEDIDDI